MAVASGVAYAYSRKEVATAVAVVPPLSVVGIGIGWANRATISVPLSLSFSHLVERVRILDGLPRGAIQFQEFSVEVESADVTLGNPLPAIMVLSSRELLSAARVDEIRAYIGRTLVRPFPLEVQSNIRR